MYKIYINDTPLVLTDSKAITNGSPANDKNMVARYPGNHRFLLNYIDMMEKNTRFDSVTLHHENYEKLIEDFKGHFKIIEAAGGLILNEAGEMAFIFRRGFWDLPKGKFDKGEDAPTTALREVREEVGLQHVDITNPIGKTRHTYRSKKGKRILKCTHWFLMETPDIALIPQTEEDIEFAVWIDAKEFIDSDRITYKSIEEIVGLYLEL